VVTDDLDVLGLLRKYENTDKLKKQAADEIERLRAEIDSTDKTAYNSLRLLYDRQLLDIKKHEAEIEYLRAENERLKHQRFDLQASDFHCWVCADFLSTARRRTDIHRLKDEEKAVRGE
jgi:flagellin-like hook-associated protein FlgL